MNKRHAEVCTASIGCPYCGSRFETRLDGIAGSQRYTEDCPICCQPIEFLLELDPVGQVLRFEVRQENE